MKVLALVLLVVASASARGSGPYLPSGWRPTGPAFYLPTEIQKPVTVALKEVPVQVEEDSSGSDALQEYGPPIVDEVSQIAVIQEVSQDITQQALPEQVTEQAFVVIETKVNEDVGSADAQEVTEQAVAGIASEMDSASVAVEKEVTETVQGKADVESQTESSLVVQEVDKVTEQVREVTEQILEIEATEKSAEIQEENVNSNLIAAAKQRTEEEVVGEVKTVEEGVKNIADALVNLENEIKAEQVQSIEEVTELKTVKENTGSVQQEPAGFLEYGPPGFTEYGPPKIDVRSELVEEQPVLASIDTNETRRRRFSPKFKTIKKKH